MKNLVAILVCGFVLTALVPEVQARWYPGKRVVRVIRTHQPVRSFLRNRQPVRKVLRVANAVRPRPVRFIYGGRMFGRN